MKDNMVRHIGEDIVFVGAKRYSDSTIVIPDGVTKIAVEAFMGKDNIEKVVVPDTVADIEQNAFRDSSVKEVVLGNGITEIKKDTFKGCLYLKRINLPDSLESIGGAAFERCESLESVMIPKRVKVIKEHTFFRCLNLKEIVLHNGIEEIMDYAFYNCGKIPKLVIPGSVKKMGVYAFSYTCMIELVLEEGIETISGSAFESCVDLKRLVCPKSLRTISSYAFSDCYSLEEAELNNGLERIEDYAFNYSIFSKITIPESVKYLGQGAFENYYIESIHCKKAYEDILLAFLITDVDYIDLALSELSVIELFVDEKQYLVPQVLSSILASVYSDKLAKGVFSEEELLNDMISEYEKDKTPSEAVLMSIIDYAVALIKYRNNDSERFCGIANDSVKYLLDNDEKDKLEELLNFAGPNVLQAVTRSVLDLDCDTEIKSLALEKTRKSPKMKLTI